MHMGSRQATHLEWGLCRSINMWTGHKDWPLCAHFQVCRGWKSHRQVSTWSCVLADTSCKETCLMTLCRSINVVHIKSCMLWVCLCSQLGQGRTSKLCTICGLRRFVLQHDANSRDQCSNGSEALHLYCVYSVHGMRYAFCAWKSCCARAAIQEGRRASRRPKANPSVLSTQPVHAQQQQGQLCCCITTHKARFNAFLGAVPSRTLPAPGCWIADMT